jgi:L-alanine-DL-glutamate epimerase-like enolase superfamily enzyme
LIEIAKQVVAQGEKRLKWSLPSIRKIAASMRRCLCAVRQAVGDEVESMIDANCLSHLTARWSFAS